MNYSHYIILCVCCAVPTIPTSSLPPATPLWKPRSAPRPTDQIISGEHKDPALTVSPGTPNDDTDIDFAPVPPDPSPGTCPHCQQPLPDEDTTLAPLYIGYERWTNE